MSLIDFLKMIMVAPPPMDARPLLAEVMRGASEVYLRWEWVTKKGYGLLEAEVADGTILLSDGEEGFTLSFTND